MGWLISAIVCYVVSAVGLLPQSGDTHDWSLTLVFAIAGTILLINYIRRKNGSYEKSKKRKIERASENMVKAEQKLRDSDAAMVKKLSPISHVAGLPVSQGTKCAFSYGKEKITVSGSGTDFNIPIERITDMTVKTNIEIQKAYVSSIGGAIGGAALFGPLGAIVGGRAKEKSTKTTQYFFIITYVKENGDIDYLSFEIEKEKIPYADAAVELFSRDKAGTKVTVNL